jgi:hypothetical protein
MQPRHPRARCRLIGDYFDGEARSKSPRAKSPQARLGFTMSPTLRS